MHQYNVIVPDGCEPADDRIRLGIEAHMTAQAETDQTKRAQKLLESEHHYRLALRMDPGNVIATQNLAILQAAKGETNEALMSLERAALLDGEHPFIHINRAILCLGVERITDAIAAAKQAAEIAETKDPSTEEGKKFRLISKSLLASTCAATGVPEQALPLYDEVLALDPNDMIALTNSCFVQTLTTAGPADLLRLRQRWHAVFGYKGERKPHNVIAYDHGHGLEPGRPLRVGYVGGDFKRHSAAMIFASVVLHHDPANVQMFLYSSLPVSSEDDMTKRFQEAVGLQKIQTPNAIGVTMDHRWRDISALSDEQADDLIRKDGIDILVDLAGHTAGGRLALFTRKPAPIQITAWGFAHGTGCPEIDYFFADPVAVRPEERQYYAEKIIDLPCIVTYEPLAAPYNQRGTSVLPYYKNGERLTFGCYARYEKLSNAYLAAVREILRQIPESRIEFKDNALRRPEAIKRILNAMPDIDRKRLLFSINTNHQEHMLSYQGVDLILNPFPHSGGLVSCEQLYMGVPYVTLYGTQAAGRTGASVLYAVWGDRAQAWIGFTPEEYAEKAVSLCQDIPALARVRKTLREEFMASPVVKGYREAVEAKYLELWQEYCRK